MLREQEFCSQGASALPALPLLSGATTCAKEELCLLAFQQAVPSEGSG